jgi:hypothetical protein
MLRGSETGDETDRAAPCHPYFQTTPFTELLLTGSGVRNTFNRCGAAVMRALAKYTAHGAALPGMSEES